MTRRGTIAAALVAGLAVAVAPASALAAQRFASPGGTGTTCSQVSPCSLVTAVNNASSGDEVIVAGNRGTYGTPSSPITTQLTDAGNVNLHGAAGQPMPVIYSNLSGNIAVVFNNGGTLSDLDVHNLASNGTGVFIGNRADHFIARGGSTGCTTPPGTTVIDTVCVGGALGLGASSSSAGTITSTFRNVTAIGGTGEGIFFMSSNFTWDVFATNLIARGGSKDIATSQSAGSVTFTLDHSNYATIQPGPGTSITPAGSGTNQTAAPVFSDLNFHQAPSSPTIDHGADSPLNGATDFEGKPRLFGAHTDIGADEYAPPSVLSESASSITAQSAVLSGSVNTEGGVASAHIDYGPTAAYGSSAPTGTPALTASPQTLSAQIGGLVPSTTYHYRVVVKNGSGTVAGPDRTFTTGNAGTTGLRAAALKKCKKKFRHNHRKRRKCRKRAKRLPL